MEFLYKLYSNENFGIGLFIVITILAFSFLVILFFGKKDEKARLEKERNLRKELEDEEIDLNEDQKEEQMEAITLTEEETEKDVATESTDSPSLESTMEYPSLDSLAEEPKNEELETFEEKKLEDLDPFVTSNLVLNTDYINNEENNEKQIEEPVSDIYHLDSILNDSTEEESIEDVLNKYDTIDENTINTEEIAPVIKEEETEKNIFTEEKDEAMSAPFSSVYLEKEPLPTEEKENLDVTRTLFDLPKRVDLPKRSDNANSDNIISSLNDHQE